MRLTVLGGSGGYPATAGACSGYLIEHDGFRLLVDPGYAIVPRLLEILPPEAIDAVLVSHGHPDHVADLNPLLRARLMHVDDAPRLPAGNAGVLNSALEAGRQADRAGAARLMLTHLMPGTDPEASRAAASRSFQDWIAVATPGTIVEL